MNPQHVLQHLSTSQPLLITKGFYKLQINLLGGTFVIVHEFQAADKGLGLVGVYSLIQNKTTESDKGPPCFFKGEGDLIDIMTREVSKCFNHFPPSNRVFPPFNLSKVEINILEGL